MSMVAGTWMNILAVAKTDERYPTHTHTSRMIDNGARGNNNNNNNRSKQCNTHT